MTESSRFSVARLFTLLGALWLAVGAFYKLFAGNPGDLPQPFFEWFGRLASKDTLYILAIATELVVITLAIFRPKLGWIALVGVYLLFEAILAPLIASGADSCGCLGGTITIHPIVMASIDGVILVGLLASRPWKASGMQALAPTAIVGLLIVAAVVAPVLSLKGAGEGPTREQIAEAEKTGVALELPRHVTLSPEEWIGMSIYDTPLMKWVPDLEGLPTGSTYVFWRWTCDHCAEHLQELLNNPPMEPVILVRVKEKHDNEENKAFQVLPEGGVFYHTEMTDQIQWVLSTPSDMKVDPEGTITEARENIEHEH